ncbi:NmrA-like protein [Lasiodiplodia theobromae]|nr:NmrA-like protein [Lasiodiplodia theobromae]
MVKVVVAGGSGNVAREVIDKIIAKQKHDIVPVDELAIDGVKCVQVDYLHKTSLVDALRGTDVVLCFFASTDQSGVVQKQKVLIDACIEAGVRRFAPSEWASGDNEGIPHYAFKSEIRKYLNDINRNQKVLEYTLFQPGLFTNYFGFPHATTKHFSMSQWFVDFENRRAITVGNGDFPLVLSTVQDMAGVVAEALDYEGEWPVDGGICGSRLTLAELIELGKTLRDDIATCGNVFRDAGALASRERRGNVSVMLYIEDHGELNALNLQQQDG